MNQETVTVGGVVYDMRTGLALRQERAAAVHHPARKVHKTLQKSNTLNRRYVAKHHAQPPHAAEPSTAPAAVNHRPDVAAHATTSQPQHVIRKFAPHPTMATRKQSEVISDIGPTRHPVVDKAAQRQAAAKQSAASMPAAIKPSSVLKQEAIADATARTKMTSHKREHKQPRKSRFSRSLSVAAASLGVLVMGGYLTYLSMPNISTRVAAAQAGIDAHYPSYRPTGYSLTGPVTFQKGSVTMKFAANAGPVAFTLTQTDSGWDSSAVLDKYVQPKAGKEYVTTTSNGLTIYTFDNNAAWVNGGILYTIDGNAPLSNEQIQRIATSI